MNLKNTFPRKSTRNSTPSLNLTYKNQTEARCCKPNIRRCNSLLPRDLKSRRTVFPNPIDDIWLLFSYFCETTMFRSTIKKTLSRKWDARETASYNNFRGTCEGGEVHVYTSR